MSTVSSENLVMMKLKAEHEQVFRASNVLLKLYVGVAELQNKILYV